MQGLPQTLSILLAMATVVGTTSFPTSMVPPPTPAMDEIRTPAYEATFDVGMCLPDRPDPVV
jgi:hypothetical protein